MASAAVGTQGVAGVEITDGHIVESHPQARDARLRRCNSVRQRDKQLLKQRFVAEQAVAAFDLGGKAASGQNLHVFGGRPSQPARLRGIDNGVGQRMVGPLLGRSGQAQQVVICVSFASG